MSTFYLHCTEDGGEFYFNEKPEPSPPVIEIEIIERTPETWTEQTIARVFFVQGGWGTSDGGRTFDWYEGEMRYAVPRGHGWVQTGYIPSCHSDGYQDEFVWRRKRIIA